AYCCRDEQEWRLGGAAEPPFYVRANGRWSSQAPDADQPDRYTDDPANPTPTYGGALLVAPEFPIGPVDQRRIEARPDVLTYTTEPLEQETEVTGPVRARLRVCALACDTHVVGR